MLDDFFMRRAIGLAYRGAGRVAPNPMVGAVLVHEGRVIGEGWHALYGDVHAEVACLESVSAAARHLVRESTMYVTLEPCPMCAGAILNSRIARVVFGARDKRLGALGSTYDILEGNPINRVVAVEGPAMEEECLEMLKGFFREIRARKKADPGEISGDSGGVAAALD